MWKHLLILCDELDSLVRKLNREDIPRLGMLGQSVELFPVCQEQHAGGGFTVAVAWLLGIVE